MPNIGKQLSYIKNNVPKLGQTVAPMAQKALIPGTLVASAGYQTYKDYKNADEGEKGKALLKNVLMLAVATAGTLICGKAGENFLKNQFGDTKKTC